MKQTATEPNSVLVEPDWLEQHLADPKLRIIEIAGIGQDNLAAYASGHIPGALGWKWKSMLWDETMRDFPSPEDFARRCASAGIANDTTVVFYGEPMQFGIYAWWVFRYCGHRDVRVLNGSRKRWLGEGRPMTTDVPPSPPRAEYKPAARLDHMRILRDQVLRVLGREDTVILDARSIEEYSGKRVGGPGGPDVGAERYGRIPGARHLEYLALLTSDESFKTSGELRQVIAARGAVPEKQVLAYCRLSHRATVIYFVLSELLGRKNVRVYDGSWTEWGSMVGVPVER